MADPQPHTYMLRRGPCHNQPIQAGGLGADPPDIFPRLLHRYVRTDFFIDGMRVYTFDADWQPDITPQVIDIT